jgi:hypothetical protein
MAKNILQPAIGQTLGKIGIQATDPASPKSGQSSRVGSIHGIAEVDMDANTNLTTVNIDCIAEISVHAIIAGPANSAVAAGDVLYRTDGQVDGSGNPMFDKVNTGVKVGYAFGSKISAGGADVRTGNLVAAGQTAIIRVMIKPLA